MMAFMSVAHASVAEIEFCEEGIHQPWNVRMASGRIMELEKIIPCGSVIAAELVGARVVVNVTGRC